jgi:hypothetical protein
MGRADHSESTPNTGNRRRGWKCGEWMMESESRREVTRGYIGYNIGIEYFWW